MIPERGRKRLLIVDDEELVRRVLVAIAERFADPVAAKSATTALVALQSTPFDVVLSDMDLGSGPSGSWLLQQVASRWPRARRCLMSASPQETTEEFFPKPLDGAALYRVVHGSASDPRP